MAIAVINIIIVSREKAEDGLVYIEGSALARITEHQFQSEHQFLPVCEVVCRQAVRSLDHERLGGPWINIKTKRTGECLSGTGKP